MPEPKIITHQLFRGPYSQYVIFTLEVYVGEELTNSLGTYIVTGSLDACYQTARQLLAVSLFGVTDLLTLSLEQVARIERDIFIFTHAKDCK